MCIGCFLKILKVLIVVVRSFLWWCFCLLYVWVFICRRWWIVVSLGFFLFVWGWCNFILSRWLSGRNLKFLVFLMCFLWLWIVLFRYGLICLFGWKWWFCLRWRGMMWFVVGLSWLFDGLEVCWFLVLLWLKILDERMCIGLMECLWLILKLGCNFFCMLSGILCFLVNLYLCGWFWVGLKKLLMWVKVIFKWVRVWCCFLLWCVVMFWWLFCWFVMKMFFFSFCGRVCGWVGYCWLFWWIMVGLVKVVLFINMLFIWFCV